MHAGAPPEIFRKAMMLRNNLTKEEHRLWSFLRNKPNGFKFRRQHPFGLFILDFYCHSARISIELDGPNHNLAAQTQYDYERTEFIKSLNVEEIRFTNTEVNQDFNRVQKVILERLRADTL